MFGLMWPIETVDVGRNQIQHLLGHRREAADAQVGADDDDGDLHAAEQVDADRC